MTFNHKHLLGIEQLSREDIGIVLDLADSMKEIPDRDIKKVPTLRGKTVMNLFFEPSTRTRTSFEVAGKMLSADTYNFTASASSTTKGESLKDTILTLNAMSPDMMVVRHRSVGSPELITRWTKASVINAGDGGHEHPTQALLDLLTVRQRLNHIDGLKVTIVGDISHSRVARSNLLAWKKVGSEVTVCGPASMIPPFVEQYGCRATYNLDEAIVDADIIMMLRIQKERLKGPMFPSLREYASLYGLNLERLKKAKPDVLIMHPGPMNRGVEIEPAVADSDYALIVDQVRNGVILRMAVLCLLMGGELYG